jgi:cullin-5
MLLRKTPLSKKLTSEEVETKLRDVVSLICSISSGILYFYLKKVHGTKEKIILKIHPVAGLTRLAKKDFR